MREQLSIKLYGHVQGVFLRMMTRDKAVLLGIAGYAQNTSDGSVIIKAAGNKENLDELLEWLRSSPGASKIKRIKVEKSKLVIKDFEFTIKY